MLRLVPRDIKARAALDDVHAVAQHAAAGGVAARARAGKAQLAEARAAQGDEVSRAVRLRDRRGGGEERGADKGGDAALVPLGADEELADPAQLAPGGEVLFLHARDAEAGDLLLLHRRAEGEVRAQHQLAPRVVALHVRSGIGLGVTERLRLAQTGGIIDAGGRHG